MVLDSDCQDDCICIENNELAIMDLFNSHIIKTGITPSPDMSNFALSSRAKLFAYSTQINENDFCLYVYSFANKSYPIIPIASYTSPEAITAIKISKDGSKLHIWEKSGGIDEIDLDTQS